MSGKQVIEMFTLYGVTDYIMSCYEALHTTGLDYIIGAKHCITTSKNLVRQNDICI
ncbi:MAG: DUF3791 domain-containing protein [Oscillospiraceae bacterium]|nr:DUF3791 domain-containing protein [Oscillospiraceae bacterium]